MIIKWNFRLIWKSTKVSNMTNKWIIIVVLLLLGTFVSGEDSRIQRKIILVFPHHIFGRYNTFLHEKEKKNKLIFIYREDFNFS